MQNRKPENKGLPMTHNLGRCPKSDRKSPIGNWQSAMGIGIAGSLTVAALMTAPALAQFGGEFTLTWSAIASGGQTLTGDDYEASGTAGQHDAGVLSGGGYEMTGGFWAGATCTCELYGDVVVSCGIDVDDILYALDSFIDPDSFPRGDTAPCGGNGVIDVDDILAVLGAFIGTYACPHPCPP